MGNPGNISRAPALASGGVYCRRCSYDLRGQVEHRCPECGRSYDPANAKTYRRRSRRRWVRRVVLAGILLLILLAAPFAWLYYDWHCEQAAVRHFTGRGATVRVKRMDVPLLSSLLPDRYGWLLERVSDIDTWGAAPSPDDLRLAASCHRVEGLFLYYSPVTRDGVEGIAKLRHLRYLWLSGPAIDDGCAQRLGQVRSLEALCLIGSSITDADLAQLCGLPELEYLHLASPHVTSAGLDTLAGLPKLRILRLFGPALDDDALTKLGHLTQLKCLVVRDGRFTPAAVQRLEQALPGCNVSVSGDLPPVIPAPPATNPGGSPAR